MLQRSAYQARLCMGDVLIIFDTRVIVKESI
jgi:hypothetical protein